MNEIVTNAPTVFQRYLDMILMSLYGLREYAISSHKIFLADHCVWQKVTSHPHTPKFECTEIRLDLHQHYLRYISSDTCTNFTRYLLRYTKCFIVCEKVLKIDL